MYPNSALNAKAKQEIDRLTNWLGTKTYQTGMFYMRRKAYDPAIIYFKDVLRLYPTAPIAQRRGASSSSKRTRRSTTAKKRAEQCASLRQTYPGSAEVREVCGNPPATAQTPPR